MTEPNGNLGKYAIELDPDPSPADLEALTAGLQEHAKTFVDRPGFEPVALFARDDGQLVGGVYGRINWNWLDVSLLWVSPACRGGGTGSALLRSLEAEAVARGCTYAHVDTFSYQARDFYVAQGYTPFAELADYPEGHSRVFLKKVL